MALIPLVILSVGICGFILTSRFPDPASVIIPFLLGNLPTVGGEVDLVTRAEGVINSLVADRTEISVVGFVVLLWVSTWVLGTVRAVLREIFDFSHGRGIIKGKIFDAFMVMVGGLLLVVNIGITVGMETVEEYGADLVGLEGPGLSFFRQVSALLLAFGSIWALFLLLYRYFPPRRIPWRTALTAATFTAVLFEIAKYLFSWYMTSVANFGSVYGNMATLAVLFIWIYNGALVFILGGEVAQVYNMNRTRRIHSASPVRAANG
jgi:membrane protein